MRAASEKRFADIREGESAAVERTIAAEDVDAFARFSGDFSPLHVDEAFAKTTRFGGRVAHGMILGTLVSTLVGMDLPGRHAILLSVSLEFRKPVLMGDRIRVEAVVARKVEANRILELAITAVNQAAVLVASGTAKVMVTA